jgi:hypothetical protein
VRNAIFYRPWTKSCRLAPFTHGNRAI